MFNIRAKRLPTARLAAVLLATSVFGYRAAEAAPDHVVVVMLENHDYSQYVNSPLAPFVNNTLINGGLLYTNSHGLEHPSQPNYLDFFSGSNQGVNSGNATPTNAYNYPAIYAGLQAQITTYQAALDAGTPGYDAAGLASLQARAAQVQPYVAYGTLATGDAFPAPSNFNGVPNVPFTTPNLAASLRDAGKTFTEYSEGLAAAGSADANGYANPAVLNNTSDPLQVGYAHRHDPVADWISTTPTGNQLPVSADQDFGNFPVSDYAALPDVSLVVPNTIHDGHDGPSDQGVVNSDTWLASAMADYLSWAKTHNSLLIVTTDENDFSPGNHILTVVNGDAGLFQPGQNDALITHDDLLRTLEQWYGAACTAAACQAAGLPMNAAGTQLAAVPEPAAALVFGTSVIGLLGIAGSLRRRH